mgnify:CR=1 FL=1|tara:strand:+ start:617 stop:856 length:240 start_codon:yes stop_codon:yes gene_type:complete
MMYYIIPQGEIDEYIPLMKQSLGNDNIWIRMSVDELDGLMEFTEEYAPKGYTGYNVDEISEIMLTPEWNVDGDIKNYKR